MRERELIKRIEKLESRINDIVYCEACGCLLDKANAFKGKNEIRERIELIKYKLYRGTGPKPRQVTVRYIYDPFYCKSHIPTRPTILRVLQQWLLYKEK